jgi:transposase-like protein
MNKRKTYSGTFKAQVVLELLFEKKKLSDLAAEYEIHPNQIKNWKSAFLRQAPEVFEDKRKKRSCIQIGKRNVSE